jgi:hypothetical protein
MPDARSSHPCSACDAEESYRSASAKEPISIQYSFVFADKLREQTPNKGPQGIRANTTYTVFKWPSHRPQAFF